MTPMPTPNPSLILASTSSYRADSLRRLNLSFEALAPQVDEAYLPAEIPSARAARLAQAKAKALGAQFPDSVLIGSDQVACCGEQMFDKPGSEKRAITMLESLRGEHIDFHTAVCVYQASSDRTIEHTDLTRVMVRSDLTNDEIVRYVQADFPIDCAGAFKVESLGISLFEHVHTDDPTALIGLPLIAVARALRTFGLHVP